MEGLGHPNRRRALVTGASSGLGAAFAVALARRGFDIVVVARRRERLEALAEDLRGRYEVAVQVLVADLTSSADLQSIESRVASDAALTILVNNAGFGTTGRFAEMDPDLEEGEIRLNVVALSRLTRAALPGMIARGTGSIINVSSVSALLPGPYHATYGATKAFVNSFTEALHEELRGTGVRVQALCPGFTRTEFQDRRRRDFTECPVIRLDVPGICGRELLGGAAPRYPGVRSGSHLPISHGPHFNFAALSGSKSCMESCPVGY